MYILGGIAFELNPTAGLGHAFANPSEDCALAMPLAGDLLPQIFYLDFRPFPQFGHLSNTASTPR